PPISAAAKFYGMVIRSVARKMSFSRIRVPREAYRFSAAMLVHDRSMKLPISAAFGLVTGALSMTIYFHRRFGCPQNAPREI
ncbi:hypothetical protein KXW28_005188, partial [Aspergillus fumigatus]